MRKTTSRLTMLVVVLAMLLLTLAPASAITDGELDGNDHPQVVLLLMELPGVGPVYRCTGTLIDATHVLTAGHCVDNFGDVNFPSLPDFSAIRVFTESDVKNGTNNYPFSGPNSVEALRWESHPGYRTGPFFLNDVGMIELTEPVLLAEYGTLPAQDQLDALKTKRGRQNTTFTSVGYGLQRINPVFIERDLIRMVANPHLIQINVPGFTGDFSLLLSNNHSTGGTCFGDSGGPNFLGDSNVVAAVTSFGINGNCAGTGGVFRVDRANVLDFIDEFVNG